MFGLAYQSGKRKVSSLTNEEFNNKDMHQFGFDEMHKALAAGTPAMESMFAEMRPMLNQMMQEIGKLIKDVSSSVVEGTSDAVSNLLSTNPAVASFLGGAALFGGQPGTAGPGNFPGLNPDTGGGRPPTVEGLDPSVTTYLQGKDQAWLNRFNTLTLTNNEYNLMPLELQQRYMAAMQKRDTAKKDTVINIGKGTPITTAPDVTKPIKLEKVRVPTQTEGEIISALALIKFRIDSEIKIGQLHLDKYNQLKNDPLEGSTGAGALEKKRYQNNWSRAKNMYYNDYVPLVKANQKTALLAGYKITAWNTVFARGYV